MKAYYIMIHFDGPYVSGFIAFGIGPWQALSLLKKSLGKKLIQARKVTDKWAGHDSSAPKITKFLQALKHPWRVYGGPRHKQERQAVKRYPTEQVVNIMELTESCFQVGYWLEDAITGQHICNTEDARMGTKAQRVR